MENCKFCNVEREIYVENEYFIVIDDEFPVTKGHKLIITKRHVKNYIGLLLSELNVLDSIIKETAIKLRMEDIDITGFNIGTNIGMSAGQSIFHFHIHVIPRRDGDCENPKGGVRGVIDGKRSY